MVIGQEIEVKRARVIDLVFRVIALHPKSARPFSKVNVEAASNRRDVGAVSLENISPRAGMQLVVRISLQGFRRLAKHNVEAAPDSFSVGRICRVVDHDIRLVQTEAIAGNIVGAKLIHLSDGLIKVVFIVAVECEIQCCSVKKTRNRPCGCVFAVLAVAAAAAWGGRNCDVVCNGGRCGME